MIDVVDMRPDKGEKLKLDTGPNWLMGWWVDVIDGGGGGFLKSCWFVDNCKEDVGFKTVDWSLFDSWDEDCDQLKWVCGGNIVVVGKNGVKSEYMQ